MEDSEDESGNLELWRLLPQLKELPEALLRKLPVSAMFQLNAALAKEKKTSEKLGINSRLAKNSKKTARNPTAVDKGQDNWKDILHPARFLGGASVRPKMDLTHQLSTTVIGFGEYKLQD